MKKISLYILGIAVSLSLVFGNSVAMAAEKIGFINVREIVTTSDSGKKMYESLKMTFDKDRAILKEKETELAKLKEEIDKQRSVMRPDVLKEKESTLQKKVRDAQLMARDFEEEITKKEQEFVNKILPDVFKIVRSIGEKEKFTIILDPVALQFPFYSKANDITKRVIDEFNRMSKKGR
ncbi:MAG: OmpH family outer membrane protein [Syntrophaceae bacterium]|nr:OmpH family outer membrane protein [Syntrophaceae bacterium]